MAKCRLQILREAAGLSRNRLAEDAVVAYGLEGAIENGRVVPAPGSVVLVRLCAALGEPVELADTLLELVDEPDDALTACAG